MLPFRMFTNVSISISTDFTVFNVVYFILCALYIFCFGKCRWSY